MEVVLKEGLDLWVRRGWYENCDFWSPTTYRQFIFPHLKEEAALAHSYGAKLGYIITSHYLPLIDMILEAGVDVLIGLDPVMGGVDTKELLSKIRGKICLWGGVNSPLVVEDGTPDGVRQAVSEALDTLAPSHGFILSPVDDVEYLTDNTWANVAAFVETWKEWRSA